MPYSSKDDPSLPDHVKEMPEKVRTAWVNTFNAMHERCTSQKGEDCEGKAMAGANAVAKRMTDGDSAGEGEMAFDPNTGGGVERNDIPDSDFVDPEKRRFPIVKPADVSDAVSSYGRADPKIPFEDFKRRLIAICKRKGQAFVDALPENWKAEMEMDVLSVIELSTDSLTDGRAFDGLASGKFTDMHSREFEFKASEFPEYLRNTLAAIEATRAESGELVGLPIDANNHDKGDGAGWIVGASLEGGKLRFLPRWTEIGRELISKGIRRFFSATVDITNKVILGGTLTNWPATRNKSGHILLRPVELSKSKKEEANMPDEVVTIDKGQLQKLVEDAVAAAMPKPTTPPPAAGSDADLEALAAEFGGLSEDAKKARKDDLRRLSEYVRKQAELEFRAEMQREQHESRMAELAQVLVGGCEAAPRGYPGTVEEIKAHLLKMAPEEAKFWGELMSKTQKEGFVEFNEVGHGREPKGTKQLPAEFAKMLDSGELTVADLSDPILALGDVSDYDLSKWAHGGAK